jgi:hypothetical protein
MDRTVWVQDHKYSLVTFHIYICMCESMYVCLFFFLEIVNILSITASMLSEKMSMVGLGLFPWHTYVFFCLHHFNANRHIWPYISFHKYGIVYCKYF